MSYSDCFLLVLVHGKVLSIRKNLIICYLILYKVREAEFNFIVYSLVLMACDDRCQLLLPIPIYEHSPPSKQTMAYHEILILLRGAGKFVLSLHLLLFTAQGRLVIIERWQSVVSKTQKLRMSSNVLILDKLQQNKKIWVVHIFSL